MAHADYNCCACCDRKLAYSNDASTKEDVCARCALDLFDVTGVRLPSGVALATWIRAAEPDVVRWALRCAGFSLCFYDDNPVDEAAREVLGDDAFDKDGRILAAPKRDGTEAR